MPHTKGPWEIIPKGTPGFHDLTITGPSPDEFTRARYMPIATVHTYKNSVYPCFYEVTEEERDANARLIAAAPELLNLLREIIKDDDENGMQQNSHITRASEFIKKLEA